jgi:glycosyltransferase involved in cell wall biosynthesis
MAKVIYFSRDYTPHDYRFLKALAESGHAIYWLRLEDRGRQLESLPLPEGVIAIEWRGGKKPVRWIDAPMLISDLRWVIREIKPDLIHAGPVHSAAFLAAAAGFRPLVTMSWGSDLLHEAERSALVRWAAEYALRRTTVFTGDCQAVKAKAVELGVPAERCVLFPWGVDLERFTNGNYADLREWLGWRDKFVILSMRSWEPVYGVDVLVRGFARAARQIPDLRLLLLGGGSQERLLRNILSKNKVLDRVQFAGQISQKDLPDYYCSADVYISASHSDGSSVSLMEALASGLPVIVSDIPGNREWVTPGEQGWLFPDGDDGELADCIVQAYQQRRALPGMGAAARRLAEQRADWPRNFQKLLEAYQLALDLSAQGEVKS